MEDDLAALQQQISEFVGVERASDVLSEAIDDAGIDTATRDEQAVIRVCRLIEQRHDGIIADVAGDFRSRRESERRFRNVVTPMPNPVFIVTAERGALTIREANEAFEDAFGPATKFGDVGGLETLADHDDPPVDRIRRAVADQRQTRFEVVRETSDGERYFIVRVAPFEGAQNPRSATVLFTDITDQKEREKRLRRLREISEVLNRVLRHNLRNDLNVVIGQAELLRRLTDEEEAHERIDRLRETVRELIELSSNARLVEEAIQRDQETERVDITSIVRSELAPYHEEAAVTVETDVPEEAWVAASERAVKTVVEQLLDNAVRHNDTPEPTLWVTVTADPEADDVSVVIRDDGPGVPEEELEPVESGSETPLRHGSGLGLWLINWLVERYGGEVTFDTTPGEGTEVVVRLPATSPDTGAT